MTIPSASSLFGDYQVGTKKRFGQHFLTDDHILSKIVDLASLDRDTSVLEIGPGCGTLTSHLMVATESVTAIELDDDLGEFLESSLVPHGLSLLRGDALKISLDSLPPKTVVVSNLPYNVGTHIMFRLLEDGRFGRMVLMFQKEVADRVCARAGDKPYGALSLRVAAYAKAERKLVLAPGAFHPPPKVRSAVVALTPHQVPPLALGPIRDTFSRLVTQGFGQRRKMLTTSLKGMYQRELVQEILRESGAKPTARPEELSFDQFCELARRLTP